MGKRVVHLIAGLGLGGAETMLYQLLLHRKDMSLSHCVISLGAENYYEEPIRKLGIELHVLPFKKRPLYSLKKIKDQIQSSETLCCWMYYGNFIGELAFHSFHRDKKKKIIWNIRHSNFERGNVKDIVILINKLCARLSKKIDIIAYNGQQARIAHEAIGYSPNNAVIQDNGCDIEKYNPIYNASKIIREDLGISMDSAIILSVAKDDPIKDLPTFINAFSMVHKMFHSTVAVMCGKGVERGNERLQSLWADASLAVGKDVFPLGLRHDIPLLLSGCDLYVLHSAGEAFPNTLIQAMACEALCVTTDVGDARRILNDDTLIATPMDAQDLAKEMTYALQIDEKCKKQKKRVNRERVTEYYDINKIVEKYEKLY